MGSHSFVAVMSMSTVFLFSGTVFGWGAMLSMLEQENFFSDVCEEVVPDKPCDAQVAALNNAFTVASSAVSLVAFGAGWLVDNAGPTKSVIVAGILNLVGYIGMAISKQNEGIFTPALTAAAVGGSLTMFIGYQVPFLLPSKFALLIAINSCLFDAGTLNFPILKVFYGAGVGFSTLFWLYAVVAMIMFPLFAVAWNMNEAEMKQIMASGGGDDDATPTDALTSKPLGQQVKTFEFVCIFIYSVVQVPRSNLYMGTVPLVNAKIAGASGASDSTLTMVNTLTEFIIPFGFLAVPPIEMSIHKMGIINTVQLTTIIGISYNAIQLIPSLGLQLVGTVIFAIWRAFLFSIISAYNGETFGVRTMGRIMGIGFFFSGVANIFLDPVVAASVDMGTFDPMLIGFLVICLPLAPLFYALNKKMTKAESAREPLRGPSMQRTRSLALASRGGSLALSRARSLEASSQQNGSQELRMN